MGKLEYPDDKLCRIFGPLSEELAALLIALDDNSNPTPAYRFREPQARNEAGWDDEKESKMKEIIYEFLRRMLPSEMGYKTLNLIWYKEGNMVSKEKIPFQRG